MSPRSSWTLRGLPRTRIRPSRRAPAAVRIPERTAAPIPRPRNCSATAHSGDTSPPIRTSPRKTWRSRVRCLLWPSTDLPRLPAIAPPPRPVFPAALCRAHAIELDPGGGSPREIAEVLAALADALARSPVRLLLPHAATILAAPAVRSVRKDRYDCHDRGRALYRTRHAAPRTRCLRNGRHLPPCPASRMPASIPSANATPIAHSCISVTDVAIPS